MPSTWTDLGGYVFDERRYAGLIIGTDYPEVEQELAEVLEGFTVSREDVLAGGGGKTEMVKSLEREFKDRNWGKKNFDVVITVDGLARESMTHEIDHVRQFEDHRHDVALEIEWNNKDPFYDRDLQNFRRLHELGVIGVGIILTRGPGLQEALAETYFEAFAGVSREHIEDLIRRQKSARIRERLKEMDPAEAAEWLANKAFQSKYGQATTHWDKLTARIARGLGDPCPLIMVGVTPERLVD